MEGGKTDVVTDPAGIADKTGVPASWRETLLGSPRLLLSLLYASIFLAALGIMNILHRIPAIPDYLDCILDSLLLLLFLYPCLVFLLKRPYLHQIRARERSEKALSESEFRMNMILENNPYFMAVRDPEGVVLLANRKYAEFYGTSVDRIIGVPLTRLPGGAEMKKKELDRILALDREVFETGEPRFGLQRIEGRDGVLRWYRYGRIPVTMSSGRRGVLVTASEITRRVHSEKTQQKTILDLEQAVAERTADLMEKNRELREAVENYRTMAEELSLSRSQLRDLSASLRSGLEEERKRISRELHDELGQSLTALKFDLAATESMAVPGQTEMAEQVKSMSRFVDTILATVKRISRDLRPGILDDLGLAAAIQWQAKEFRERTEIPCEVVAIPEEMALDPDRSTAMFRIFQETLTNVARHAVATKVEAILESRDGAVCLEVRDNGRGITKEETSGSNSLGLIGIRERARWWGGEVRIEGSPGAGTTVAVTLPAWNEGRVYAQHTRCG